MATEAQKEASKRYYYKWREENVERVKRYNQENKDKKLDWYYRKTYNISLEQFNDMLLSQNNKCAVCLLEETAIDKRTGKIRRLHVDHCHKTGKVRGLLCTKCNIALGYLSDSLEIAQLMVRYIETNC